MSGTGFAPNDGEDQQHIHLACQACQRKKIKCDRNFPCGQCTHSSLHCVPSTRKPRTRHAGRRAVDGELRTRISKLESLVDSLSGEVGLRDDTRSGEASVTPATDVAENASTPSVGKYIGGSFWSSLTTEVQALRDVLEEDQHEDETDSLSPPTSSEGVNGQSANEYDLIILPPGAIYVMPGSFQEPSSAMQSVLHETFIQNVAPMFKVGLCRHTPQQGGRVSTMFDIYTRFSTSQQYDLSYSTEHLTSVKRQLRRPTKL